MTTVHTANHNGCIGCVMIAVIMIATDGTNSSVAVRLPGAQPGKRSASSACGMRCRVKAINGANTISMDPTAMPTSMMMYEFFTNHQSNALCRGIILVTTCDKHFGGEFFVFTMPLDIRPDINNFLKFMHHKQRYTNECECAECKHIPIYSRVGRRRNHGFCHIFGAVARQGLAQCQ